MRIPIGVLVSVWVVAAVAQTPYEILEVRMPNEPGAQRWVQFLNNSGQIAGSYFGENAGVFVARWEPGKTNLTDVRYYGPRDFQVPAGIEGTRLVWAAFYDSGEGYAMLVGQRRLEPPRVDAETRREFGTTAFTRLLRYSGDAFHPVKDFESSRPTFGAPPVGVLSSSERMVRLPVLRYGGDGGDLRYPTDASGFGWNPLLPHHPEVWALGDPGGAETRLPTGLEVLNRPGDYRYRTSFRFVDDSGTLYGTAVFRTHPPTSSGRPVTGTRHEVWVNGRPRSLADFAGPLGGSFHVDQVNRDGEISGRVGSLGVTGVPIGGRLAIYLPRPNFGRVAGFHVLTTTEDPVPQDVSRLSRQGSLVWGTGNLSEGRLWSGGVHTPLQALVPKAATSQVLTGARSLINDRGWILTEGRDPDPRASPDFRLWLLRPLMEAEAFLGTNRVFVSDTFTFTLRVWNSTSTPRTLGLPIGFRFTGDARFELVGASLPSGTRIVPAFGSLEVRQVIRATNAGSSTWYSQGRLFGAGVSNDTAVAYTESLRVLDRADLHIKRAGEGDDAFGVNDEYQAMPAGPQVRTNGVTASELSEFHVRVENDDTRSRTFRLRVDEGLDAEGWEVVHRLGDDDVSAAIRSGAGLVLPELAPARTHRITLRVRGTNAPAGTTKRVLYTLEDSGEPGEIRDVVEAVTELGGEVLVNSTGDESDADPLDHVADVDLAEPGAQTTLRAAIEFANRRPGRDRIEFGIPQKENVFEGGVPVIRPRSGLPVVTESAVIDGWTQDPTSATPPVVLNGSRIAVEGDLPTHRESWSVWAENPAAAHGLEFDASEGRVTGLVVQQFPLFGIRFRGDGHVVEGNFVGTDATGSFSRANGVQASLDTGLEGRLVGGGISGSGSGNRIGGVGARSGNLVAGLSDGYLALRGGDALISGPSIELFGDRNEVLGNWIGVDRTGDAILGGLAPSRHRMTAGVIVSGNLNRIGGSGPGEGNVVLAVGSSGISVQGNHNRISGNRVGVGDSGRSLPRGASSDAPVAAGGQVGIRVEGSANEIGGLAPGEGNVVGNALAGVSVGGMLGGDRVRVHGNRIGVEADGRTAAPLEAVGIRLRGTRDGDVASNTVAHVVYGNGVEIVREGAFDPEGTGVGYNRIFSVGSGLPGPTVGTGAGILVGAGRGHRLVENEIRDTAFRGIQLHDEARPQTWTNDDGDADTGPNAMQNHPVLTHARAARFQGVNVTEVEGVLRTARGPVFGEPDRYVVEVFFGDRAGPDGFGEAASLLSSQTAPIDATGEFAFRWLSSKPVAEPGQWITATATDPKGNTSMLSPAVLVQGEVDEDADAMSDAVEDLVGGPAAPAGLALAGLPAVGSGDGNGDGIPDARQSGVVSFPSTAGPWLTLVAPDGAAWVEVRPTAAPPEGRGAEGFVFPVGWVEFGLRGVVPGSAVEVVLVAHGAVGVEGVIAGESTSTDARPRAIAVPSTVEGSRVRVTLRDGGTEDRDGVADGVLRARLGLRRREEAGPELRLSEVRSGVVDRPGWGMSNGRWQVVGRPVFSVTGMLSWPASATDWWPERNSDPAALVGWEWVAGQALLRGDRWVTTHLESDPVRFYRLRRRP